ncbi:hypothetical protein BDQ17DRAFT_1303766 [Cyathus striatus]|nr:hypothetical protein BDQ17DRAFT_1303766 [Cyathus striatus]
MRRYNRTPSVPSELSIPGDELEEDRQALESNLQQTDLSLRLSSASDDDLAYHHQHHYDSVEYPRHYSNPSAHDYPSFHREHTFDNLGDEDGHMNITYRTEEDEEGINPYGGETMSTAGHHASALTLSAGLGGRGMRRDVSLSGAEYDPDRPLHDMIAGVDRLSMFDMDPSRSKHTNVNSVVVDPLVVDDTAELDRILESGRNLPSSLHSRLRSPLLSSSSASDTDSGQSSQSSTQNRPKLTDALRRVSFSPKRPRSPQVRRSPSANHQYPPVSPLARPSRLPDNTSMNVPTPRPARRQPVHNSTPRPTSSAQPEVRLQPPTPSSVSSKFTRMARGIKGEIEVEQRKSTQELPYRPSSAPAATSAGDTVFQESFVNNSRSFVRNPTPRRPSARGTPRGKVQLPDVTGMTSAVESPAKFGADYYRYPGDDRPRESEARLLQTLATVQSKLQHLEDENGISRRRVRELEMELEECKREVARERTRLLEREDIIVQQQQDLSSANAKTKAKGKARETTMMQEEEEDVLEKYREAVEEKKALEALISSLRTHLTRLTSELSSHRELLAELRRLRDSDSRSLKQKGEEIMRLKNEVERLAGEVEVLRGVVEEGLKERRSTRDVTLHQPVADTAMSQDMEESEEEEEQAPVRAHEEEQERREEREESEEESEEDSEEELEPFDPTSIQGSSRGPIVVDRTMRTDHATLGSSLNLAESTPRRVMKSEDYNRIATEVEERRSNRSFGSKSISELSQLRSRTQSPVPVPNPSRHGVVVEDISDEEGQYHQERVESPTPMATLSSSQRNRVQIQNRSVRESPPRRPAAPTAGHASRPTRKPQADLETPFPQIRGERLERLFFSAPEHNARTCTMCNRRRRQVCKDAPVSPPWFPTGQKRQDDDEDEGFEDGSEETEYDVKSKGKQKEIAFSSEPHAWKKAGEKEGIPPQTVVVRVIRELEDDFTHYKGIYVELADQYKEMDAASDVAKRNILAQHLREVVDILEQKGDQIAALYDLLSFRDKPTTESIVPSRSQPGPSSWGRSTSRKVSS